MDATPPATPLRVLVVEDSVDESFLIRHLLEARGHQVRTAQDGQTALAMWDEGEFDVVVTDLNLPGMDGVQLTAALVEPRRDAVVIAVTGYTDRRYVESARRAGALRVIPKPIDPEALVTSVEAPPSATPRASGEGPRSVLVIAARAGDAIFGCGGTLVRHRTAGDTVTVHLLDPRVPGTEAESAVRDAARVLEVEVRLHPDGPGLSDDATDDMLRIIGDAAPDVVYLPSEADHDRGRRDVHRSCAEAVRDVPEAFGYLTPSATLDFHPDILKIVTPQMSTKLDAVLALSALRDPALSGRFVGAAARWWGRSVGFAEVEPFEHLTR